MNIFDLKNKVIVITGGLGLLGSQFATYLIGQGAKVAVFDIIEHHDAVVILPLSMRAFIVEHPNRRHDLLILNVDVTKKQEIKKGLKKVIINWGVPHGLINCAAIDFPPKDNKTSFENYPEEEWDKVMAVNVKGIFLCCQVIGVEMAEKERGSIINIGSTYGMVSPDQRIYDSFIKPVSYATSKSALLNLTRYLATYWGKKNVRVNTLTFGGVYNNQEKGFVEKYCEHVPLSRMAQKDEYNGAVQFLLSDASSYMTGANLVIDGGWTAW